MTGINTALITHLDKYGEMTVTVIEYNTMFSFAETPGMIIFLLNDSPIKVIPKDRFLSLDLEYHQNPDDAPAGENVVPFATH